MKTIITIGSGKQSPSHLILNGDFISDQHGELVIFENDRIAYEDYSSNGTTVNGQLVNNSSRPVKRGDTIIFPKDIPLAWSSIPVIPKADDQTFAVVNVGREAGLNQIVLPGEQIGRTHATIYVQKNGNILLYDKSVNGVSVNGMQVQRWKQTPVKRGDRVVFAGLQELDWNKVPKPPVKKRALVLGVLGLVLLAFGVWLYGDPRDNTCSIDPKLYPVYVVFKTYGKLTVGSDVLFFGSEASQGLAGSVQNLKPFVFAGTAFGVLGEGYFATNEHVVKVKNKGVFYSKLLDGAYGAQMRELQRYIVAQKAARGANIYVEIEEHASEIYLVKQGFKLSPDELLGNSDLPPGKYHRAKFMSSLPMGGGSIFNDGGDLAIIKLENAQDTASFKYIPRHCFGNDEVLAQGDEVFYYGYPDFSMRLSLDGQGNQDVIPHYGNGKINMLQGANRLIANYQNGGGASGSPVFNKQKKLVAINVAMMVDSPGQVTSSISHAILVGKLEELLESMGLIN